MVGAWLAENPGQVSVHWFNYQIDTSFAFIVCLFVVGAMLLSMVITFFRRLMYAPEYISNRRRIASYEKGLAALTHSVAALATSDMDSASKYTKKAQKLLGRTPITLLLSAQVAKTQGDDAKTQALLTQMLDHKETEYLAARSLSEAASTHNIPSALALAQRALAINPQGVTRVASLHLRLHQWQQALQAVTSAARKRGITRSQKNRYFGLIYLEQGLEAERASRKEEALVASKTALKYVPDFTPAVAFAARTYHAQGNDAKAFALLAKQWRKSPDSTTAEAFRLIVANLPIEKQRKMAQKLASYNPAHIESELLLAEMAMAARDWQVARKLVKSALTKQETSRPCRLMAQLEQSEYADFDASHEWHARALTATPDASWNCSHCGTESTQWSVHCPSCHSFDSLTWKPRIFRFVG